MFGAAIFCLVFSVNELSVCVNERAFGSFFTFYFVYEGGLGTSVLVLGCLYRQGLGFGVSCYGFKIYVCVQGCGRPRH